MSTRCDLGPGETQPARDICKPTLFFFPGYQHVAASVELISASPDVIAQEGAERRRQLPKRKTWRPASELAVDLGTANTLVLVKGEGVVLNEPSVAAVDQATGNIMGIGLEAKRMLGPRRGAARSRSPSARC
jgi:hypothetical protein